MTETMIRIGAHEVKASNVTLPADRKFRDFWVLNGDVVEVDWDAALADARNKATISRGNFALAAAKEGWITEAEALAWAGGNAIPTWVNDLIEAGLPPEEQLRIKVEVLTNQSFPRLGILMPLLQSQVPAATDEVLDGIYGIDVGP